MTMWERIEDLEFIEKMRKAKVSEEMARNCKYWRRTHCLHPNNHMAWCLRMENCPMTPNPRTPPSGPSEGE